VRREWGESPLPQPWTTNKKFVNFANLPSLILGGGEGAWQQRTAW